MRPRLITPPTVPVLSTAEARLALRYEATETDLDPLIAAWVDGITAHAEDYTGRAFISQKWRTTGDFFPSSIRLRPPVISVESVKYIDTTGVERTLDPSDYVVDLVSAPGCIVPAPGKAWPATKSGAINTVTVDFTCGYGEASADVPATVKPYIIARLVEQFDGSAGTKFENCYLDRMLDLLRLREFG